MASNTTSDNPAPVPGAILDTFLPGFSVIRHLLEGSFGIDITTIVSAGFVIAALFSAGGYAWDGARRFFTFWFASSVEIRSGDDLYDEVRHYQSKKGLATHSRALAAETSNRRDNHELSQSLATRGERFDYAEIEGSVPPEYTVAYDNTNTIHYPWSGKNPEKARMRITCLGWSPEPIKAFLMDCKRWSVLQRRDSTTIRRAQNGTDANWKKTLTRPSRPLETIYMDETIKSGLLADINEYLDPNAAKFYARRGIPYRRGYLFHGPPGTGKTSTSLGLAGHFGFDLYIVSLLEPHMTEQKLSGLFSELPPHCIVLIEDIDSAGLQKREDDDESLKKERPKMVDDTHTYAGGHQVSEKVPEGGITLAGLLNAIDGVASHEGRILIMTTNNPESLDRALIRPGRVDMQVYFGKASRANAREIFFRMFSDDQVSSRRNSGQFKDEKATALGTITTARLEGLAIRFADLMPGEVFTPAEVQGYLLKHKKEPEEALAQAKVWRDTLLKTKEKGKNIFETNVAKPETSVGEKDDSKE